jgi:signal transduction histidine kinase
MSKSPPSAETAPARSQPDLHEVIESISSELALRPLLTRIVQHACELLGADRGTIGLVDAERHLIRTEAAYRMPPDELGAEMPPGVGLAGAVFEAQKPIILNRYGELDHPVQPSLTDDAVIGLPIFWRGRMVAFFGIGAAPPRHFTPEDVALLSTLARHAAVAIDNAQMFDHTQRALTETQLLYETSERISTAMNVTGVIEAYLAQVATRGRYACSVVLYEFDSSGRRVAVVVRGRWAPEEGFSLANVRLPYSRDALDPLLDAGQTVAINDVHTDARVPPELVRIQTESGRPALALIPLIARQQRIGLVVLSYPVVHEWQESALRPYQATAVQLAGAIDSRRQQRLLQERSQQLAVLEERQRLARELHDSVTQLIFSVTLIAQSIAPAWRRDPAEGEERIRRLLELSQSALAEMRALLAELRPSESHPVTPEPVTPGLKRLQREGLPAALRLYLAEIAGDNLEVDVNTAGYFLAGEVSGTGLPVPVEETLYRVGQEALNNVVKHARAGRVAINLHVGPGVARLIISDDGQGFMAPDNANGLPGRFGLQTMRERVEAAGGDLRLTSTPGVGTAVAITLSWQEV